MRSGSRSKWRHRTTLPEVKPHVKVAPSLRVNTQVHTNVAAMTEVNWATTSSCCGNSRRYAGVITAMLDTACRPGEVLTLQWADVSLTRRELTIRAEKEKTRRERVIPISSRLLAILEMRQHDLAGRELPPDAYVFGDPFGCRVKSVREAWKGAAKKAGLHDFQLRDLRHEAGSRFDEAGMPIIYVSTMLGHSNLSTTSRYLNINRRGLHLAMRTFDATRQAAKRKGRRAATQKKQRATERASQESVAHALHTDDAQALAVVPESRQTGPAKALVS
jgi:integrase